MSLLLCQVIVTGLPMSASWQDLKDHMRQAGDVGYCDVDKKGGGIVEYINKVGGASHSHMSCRPVQSSLGSHSRSRLSFVVCRTTCSVL